jgi:hypothetical protein
VKAFFMDVIAVLSLKKVSYSLEMLFLIFFLQEDEIPYKERIIWMAVKNLYIVAVFDTCCTTNILFKFLGLRYDTFER